MNQFKYISLKTKEEVYRNFSKKGAKVKDIQKKIILDNGEEISYEKWKYYWCSINQ